MTAALPGQEGLPPVETYDGEGPVLGSQAADNAAWNEVRAAVLAGDEIDPAAADEVTARVVPVLARLVDSVRPAVAADGPVLGEEARRAVKAELSRFIQDRHNVDLATTWVMRTLSAPVAALLVQARAAGATLGKEYSRDVPRRIYERIDDERIAYRDKCDAAITLLEDAVFLRMYDERPPGHEEVTWASWEQRAERFLREDGES